MAPEVAAGPNHVTGRHTGVDFPTTIEPLLVDGPAFLTRALRATGVLSSDNAVTAIVSSREFFGGGMGRKLLIEIDYARPDQGLHRHLFAKFPRMFGDPLRDLFGPLMEPEVRFALLSLRPGFPIAVPRCYFADYDPATVTGLLITERIAYGAGSIEPCPEKCMDYLLDDPLPHYRALTTAMARLAGAQKAGKLGNDLAAQFPFDPDAIDPGSRIPYDRATLAAQLEKLRTFATRAPQLFPDDIADYIDTFIAEVPLVLDLELAIRRALNQRGDMVALCHWNMNLDNAWFWRGDDGVLQAGLLDWGSVGQMNVAQGFFGMTCAAEPAFLRAHKADLIAQFVREYAEQGGPALTAADMDLLVKLSIAVLGTAWMLDAPSLVEQQVPDFAEVTDRTDPQLAGNFLARAQAHLLLVFISEWRDGRIGDALRRFAADHAIPLPA
ncbi:hypothetical protein [Novosphingobium lentum]|uniref:hypothetical protein n=1 Tax=Novosphingobium lentum TaxID=145287 RepID=UPI0012ED6B87|nr:hypothetical protein [Novosphingobium lentum]